jgi:hypothetical protein
LDATADHIPRGGLLTPAKIKRIDLQKDIVAIATGQDGIGTALTGDEAGLRDHHPLPHAGQDGIGFALTGDGELWNWGLGANNPWQLANIDPKDQPTKN